jgi:ribonuclease HI
VKEQNLAEKYLQVWKLKSVFKSAEFHHIRREKNTVADSLVNEALDEAAKS